MSTTHEVVLLRHGETRGYHDDVGLTERGEAQAREAGATLAGELAGGTVVALRHAPTARATATAEVLRAALGAALGRPVAASRSDPHFDSLRFHLDGAARESSGVAARRLARADDGDRLPDWVAEYDRFDTDYGALSKLGGPIDRWMTSVTRHFEPPQAVVHRAWAGIRRRAAEASAGEVTVVASHSALLRALAATAIGHDPGEPANLEAVRVEVAGDLARVRYREHAVNVEVPTTTPPWLDASYPGT